MLAMAARMRSGAVPAAPAPAEPQLDTYQFPLSSTASDLPERLDCDRSEQQQAAKWAKWHKLRKLPPKDTLKKLCRKGIPAQYRAWAWPEISGAADRRAEHLGNYFEAMVNMGNASSEFGHQIELDLPRTFPNNVWIRSEEGQGALRRVLLAFSVHNHEVGYCQSMNYIAALLLLAMERDEEKTFWVLVSLIDDGGAPALLQDSACAPAVRILYQDMYAKNLKGCHVEMRSLEELLSVKLPRLYQHFKMQACEMSLIATDWFLCLFCTTLPAETTARVWDALLFEGTKILYRVALALLQTQERSFWPRTTPATFCDPASCMQTACTTATAS
eukprot:jgi/Botrbrau1/17676/Bobra.0166s0101.1